MVEGEANDIYYLLACLLNQEEEQRVIMIVTWNKMKLIDWFVYTEILFNGILVKMKINQYKSLWPFTYI